MQKHLRNGNTYEVHDETVCCPSGRCRMRNYFEIYMPEKTMTFNQFEAFCKTKRPWIRCSSRTWRAMKYCPFPLHCAR